MKHAAEAHILSHRESRDFLEKVTSQLRFEGQVGVSQVDMGNVGENVPGRENPHVCSHRGERELRVFRYWGEVQKV